MSAEAGGTVRFGRLERRGVLLGLSAGQLAAVSGALVVLVLAEYTHAARGVLVSAPVWALLAVAGLVTVRGRSVMVWLPIWTDWMLRVASRGTTHRTRPLEARATGALTLPGIKGHLEVLTSASTGAAYVFDPRTDSVTVIAEIVGRGFLLDDSATQDHRVAGWGRLLASLCQRPEILRVQVLHRSSQGGATRARRWWAAHALDGSPWVASLVADLLADAEEHSDRHECHIAIALRSPQRRGRLTAATLGSIDQHVVALNQAMSAAELEVRAVATAERLGQLLRGAYDPVGAARASAAGDGASGDGDRCAPMVGPMGVVEAWDWLRTDSALHAVYWIEEWPRSDVHPGFLQPLLLSPGARRSLTLIAEPMSSAKAFREIRRAKVEHTADAAQRDRIGRLEDEATRAEAADLVRREQDLVAGHGDLRFAGLITVSATTRAELDAACLATETAAAQAMCVLRRLVGQQARAHAAASLPLARGLL